MYVDVHVYTLYNVHVHVRALPNNAGLESHPICKEANISLKNDCYG